MNRRFGFATLIVLVLLSCSRKENAVADSTAASLEAPVVADRTVVHARSDAPTPSANRLIARKASMSLIVDEVTASTQTVASLAERHGGYVASSRSWRAGDEARASLTLQVPAAALDAVMRALRTTSKRVETENVTSEEFTQEYVDLESRLRNLRATEEELRALLAVIRQRTQKATEILEVHERVMAIRGEIEQAQGRMIYLRNITSFSTLQVDLAPNVASKPVVTSGWAPKETAVSALRALTSTLQWMASVLIWFGIYIVPMIILFALLVWGMATLIRMKKNYV